jgi:hypothetical protein
MTVVCDDKRRAVIPGAKPGDRFEVDDEGKKKVFTLLEPARPDFSEGRLILDKATGLMLWTGDVGEDDADAVIRNRAHDE